MFFLEYEKATLHLKIPLSCTHTNIRKKRLVALSDRFYSGRPTAGVNKDKTKQSDVLIMKHDCETLGKSSGESWYVSQYMVFM